jgi:hypothetical protein
MHGVFIKNGRLLEKFLPMFMQIIFVALIAGALRCASPVTADLPVLQSGHDD